MEKNNLIAQAIDNLNKYSHLQGEWTPIYDNKEIDGEITFHFSGQTITRYSLVRQELRHHQVAQLEKKSIELAPFMIIAGSIFPKLKEDLIQKNISYLEANGNLFLRQNDLLIWIDTQKPIASLKEKGNRAFSKTGLKVVFHFLVNAEIVNLPYRDIAQTAKVGLGNINYVLNGLKDKGFLVKLDKAQSILTNKQELLLKWAEAYQDKLKPALFIGSFRFAKDNDRLNWKQLPLQNQKTYWGGEPAGDLLTHHLRPAGMTLYTSESKNELIKNYRLIPDENGSIKAYWKFWDISHASENSSVEEALTVPPILVFADLINENDKRCRETAQLIYEQFIQPNL